ncbi:MAG: peptidylprolyl isomerase [Hyphomicrobium sp.]|nr:MAG: peptidylprolyl isomerase [Hyphomicrobium sp.]
MMEAMRRGARGWVGKILFFFLIVSFGIWGIADVFTGFNRTTLAKVGSTTITANEFQQGFQNELNLISQQAGRRITPEQGRQFGLDTRAMSRLVGSAAIETHARELNLALSDDTLVADIQNEPSFKGLDGKFSRLAFESYLRQIGLSEAAFFKLKRKDELREQLTGALANAIVVPQPMIDVLHAYTDEARTIEHITIDAGKSVKIAEPEETQLKESYEANKRQFVTPEYRKLAVLMLSVDDLKSKVTVTDDEIKSSFEQDKESYSRIERRRIQQIAFKDKAAAEAAKTKIAGGQSFTDAAAAAGAKETDINLGLVTKKDLIDPKIADAAFKLEKDVVSEVIEGRFATVLIRATEIQAGKEAILDEVKDRVRDKLAKAKARLDASKLHDGVDDNRAAGKTLKDIAGILNIPLLEVAAADKANKTPDGKQAIDSPDGEKIMRAGFEAQIGVERDPVELTDGGFAWVELLANTPETQKPFDIVKAEVKMLYMDTERKKAMAELSAKLAERVKNGETLAAIALEVGGKLETTPPVTRAVIPQGLTQAAVTQAFVLAKGAAGTTDTPDAKSRILFKVVDVRPAAPATKEQRETLSNELKSQIQGDLISSYVTALQDRLGVTINQAELKRISGADAAR